jgi:hypothetical protein
MRDRAFLVRWVSLFSIAALAAITLPALADDKGDKGGDSKPDPKKDEKPAKDDGAAKATEPVTCVTMAKSWDVAIKIAKAQNVPIVLHNHGFYCPPCWGLHETVMGDKTYIEFAYENDVEVLALDRLQEGVTKKEERAATYDAKEGGKPVKYLIQFPGLTVDEVLALRGSKASSYNKSGGLPYTAIIDPFTEEEVKSWKGGAVTTAEIMEAVTEARKTLTKAHGKSKPRPEIKAITDVETAAADKLKVADFAAALDAYALATKKADKDGWPAHLRDRITKGRDAAIAAATDALDKIEAGKADDAVKAKKDLLALASHLHGTGLEQRAKDLLAGM